MVANAQKKILFIDDEKELFEVINKIFPKDSYRVICAADGLEALQKCRNEDFDIVISDYRMPKMDGLKFFQQLREMQDNHKKARTPVLFVSGFADEVKSKRESWDNCDFLNKPYQIYEIVQKVGKLLGTPTVEASAANDKTDQKAKVLIQAGEKLVEEGAPGDFVFYLVSGSLQVCKRSQSGKDVVLGNVFPGELIGEWEAGSSHPYTIIAAETSELIIIPIAKMSSIIDGQSKWVKLMLTNLDKRLKQALKQIA